MNDMKMIKRGQNKRVRALVLFSGGLDSILAARMMVEQLGRNRVEGVHFTDPFSSGSDIDSNAAARKLGIRLHAVDRTKGLLKVLHKPKHGFGRAANPCIDCRIASLKKAWRFAGKNGFDFLVTGEVVGQRPMSQKRPEIIHIEKEAGLRGKIVRPLSARLLPETLAEKKGWINRSMLLDINGRSRKRQMQLAKKYGIRDYPSPAGGCLLTDANYGKRVKDFIEFNKKTKNASRQRIRKYDIELLKIGRHFRAGNSWIIVGRNIAENKALLSLCKKIAPKPAILEADMHAGPITIVQNPNGTSIRLAAGITARYSDAPKGKCARVCVKNGRSKKKTKAKGIKDTEIEKYRV